MRVFPTVVDGTPALGVLIDDHSAVVLPAEGDERSPVVGLLSGGPAALGKLRADAAAAQLAGGARPVAMLPRPALLPAPGKILCVGFNYDRHATEMDVDVSSAPNVFCKFSNSVVGPGDAIVMPAASHEIDYEGELAVVIGRRCFDVGEAEALSYVGGYTIMNDVSARDLQFRTSQWTLGKAMDTFAPLGPVLTTPDEIPDPQDLRLTTRVNGEVRQDANTSEMIFSVARIIATISRSMTLECGDVIATGTPEGVGYKRTPPKFLVDGDLVEIEIERIGVLSNPVRAAASVAATAGGAGG